MNDNINGNEFEKEIETTTDSETTTENINQNADADEHSPEPEEVSSLSDEISDDLSNGLHSVLYTPINDVTIRDVRIRDVFSRLIKEVEFGASFSIMDILVSAENCVKNGEPDENSGNLIYAYDTNSITDIKTSAKLMKNSVANLYSLFNIHNGITLDLDAVGGSISSAESKRYLLIPPKKENKILKYALKQAIQPIKVGEVIGADKLLFSQGNDIVATVEKNLLKSNGFKSVDIGNEHFDAFLSGYRAVCSLTLCNCVSKNNIIRFGLKGSLSDICARALGFFAAATYLKTMPIRMVFTTDNSATVAVSRPKVADGDYLYLLKLRKDVYEMPDKGHFGQLYYYLNEKKRAGIIKDVLPCGENINRVINRLCNDELRYDMLTEIPQNCFGVIVSVGRGESVNGIELGCFKSTL